MNNVNRTRLLKVLALADSSHDGEAVSAVRMARQLLAQDGMSFADLAKGAVNLTVFAQDHTARMRGLEAQVTDLQHRLMEAQRHVQERNTALAAVNGKLQQLELAADRTRSEVEKWRNLARDTANKLWDIGQQIAEDRAVSHTVAGQLQEIRPVPRPLVRPPAPPASGLPRERRFVRNSLLEAQESGAPAARAAAK